MKEFNEIKELQELHRDMQSTSEFYLSIGDYVQYARISEQAREIGLEIEILKIMESETGGQ